jgi:hypothetical protein
MVTSLLKIYYSILLTYFRHPYANGELRNGYAVDIPVIFPAEIVTQPRSYSRQTLHCLGIEINSMCNGPIRVNAIFYMTTEVSPAAETRMETLENIQHVCISLITRIRYTLLHLNRECCQFVQLNDKFCNKI